jgi:tetratricopeptide (TPR) repeat protein
MAKRKVEKKSDETIIDIVEARDNISDYINDNKGLVFGIIGGIILLVAGYFIYKYAVVGPKEREAVSAMTKAQEQFAKDSFALALENPGAGFEGFLDIADNYSGTATANTAKYYAGVSYLNLGRYQDAIDMLESVKAKGEVLPVMKNGNLGDAYSENGDFDKAMSFYKKAATAKENSFLTPYYMNKLALLEIKNGNVAAAQKLFTTIKNDYPNSYVAADVEKFLIN